MRCLPNASQCGGEHFRRGSAAGTTEVSPRVHQPQVQIMIGQVLPGTSLRIDGFSDSTEFTERLGATVPGTGRGMYRGIEALQQGWWGTMLHPAILLRGGDHNW
jgi:hypothetical protein